MHHERYFSEAVQAAREATCSRRKCGSVVVSSSGKILGRGVNGPPAHSEDQRRCHRRGELHDAFKSDKTCCVHAEWRAIFAALREFPQEISGSSLYFASVSEAGEMLFSGEPYCTICSKIALDVGIAYFCLWHECGIRVYTTEEYNDVSFAWKP